MDNHLLRYRLLEDLVHQETALPNPATFLQEEAGELET